MRRQRTAQLRAAAQHLHNLGPRSTFEFLCATSRPALTVYESLEQYARLRSFNL